MSLASATLPHLENEPGHPRQFGIELEFGQLSVADAARVCARVLGGTAHKETDYRWKVTSRLGDFGVETDMHFLQELGEQRARGEEPTGLARVAEQIAAPVAESIMPTEIVAPPLPLEKLPILDEIALALGEAGAVGTSEGLLYAFGLQINADVWSKKPADILATIRAFCILHPLLLRWLQIDRTRRISQFIQPYPVGYVIHVLEKNYQPDLATLIDDYLLHNASRNRALDCLCLFAHLDPERVYAVCDRADVKARPAYHYRLPNSLVGTPDWSVTGELRSWAMIEQLASDPDLLEEAAREMRSAISHTLLLYPHPEEEAPWVRTLLDRVSA